MPTPKPWTPERLAQRVQALVAEHGVPNRFQLREIAGDSSRADALSISRIARLQSWAVNKHLAEHKLAARYELRQGPDRPANVVVSAA